MKTNTSTVCLLQMRGASQGQVIKSLTDLPRQVPPPHGVQLALQGAQVEEGPLGVERGDLQPAVEARVVAVRAVQRRLPLGVVGALA